VIRPRDFSLRQLSKDIREGKPFTFSRWGDGEWRAVLGTVRGANCDGHAFFPEMGEELQAVLRSQPSYLMGMQPFATRLLGQRIEKWLASNKLTFNWINADVFHKAAGNGKLGRLIQALQERKVVIVGPDHLKRINKLVPYAQFVDVPPKNAFLARRKIVRETLAALDSIDEPAVVSVSASMPAEIILHELYAKAGQRHTLIDFGSLWDQYVGVKSRKYMQAGTPAPVIPDA